jgi:hypothetical protein
VREGAGNNWDGRANADDVRWIELEAAQSHGAGGDLALEPTAANLALDWRIVIEGGGI